MAEVVYNSLQYLSDDDVEAMAVYLKALPPARLRAAADQPGPAREPQRHGKRGARSTSTQCAMCHGEEGKGLPPSFPPLAGNQSITMASPVNSIRMVLNGGYAPGTRKNPRPHGMPPFSHILDDEEAARRRDLHPRGLGQQRHARSTPRQVNELRKLLPE